VQYLHLVAHSMGRGLGGAGELGVLAAIPPPLPLGEAPPNTVIDRSIKRVIEAFASNRTVATDLFGLFVLERAGRKPKVRVEF
jgi:hypothetical protein